MKLREEVCRPIAQSRMLRSPDSSPEAMAVKAADRACCTHWPGSGSPASHQEPPVLELAPGGDEVVGAGVGVGAGVAVGVAVGAGDGVAANCEVDDANVAGIRIRGRAEVAGAACAAVGPVPTAYARPSRTATDRSPRCTGSPPRVRQPRLRWLADPWVHGAFGAGAHCDLTARESSSDVADIRVLEIPSCVTTRCGTAGKSCAEATGSSLAGEGGGVGGGSSVILSAARDRCRA